MIVQDYVNALDSFALAMPIVGGDAESTWAADTIHVMTKRVKEGQRAFLESMSEIYQMQNYIAYGMSYRIATIGLAHDTSRLCSYVLKDMLASSDSLNQAIIADDYKSVKTWNVIRFDSILNMQLFYTLNGMNCQPQYEDRDLNYSVLCQMALDSITCKGQLTDKELFQASCFLESTAFFKMIVPLIILFDSSSGFVEKHKDYITEAAHYFDAKANPVFSLAYDGKDMPFLNDKEFEDYLVMATRYKASLLRIATQEMLAMKERRTSN
ncbi:MAG: hypothetical protein J5971_03470 [Prevotella sp.]|nr:hypothetical protein [Prevotella sp.]